MRLWRDDWAGALGWLVLTGYPIVSSWITGLQAHPSALFVILSALLVILSALLVILSAVLVILSAVLVILSAVEGSLLPKLQSCREILRFALLSQDDIAGASGMTGMGLWRGCKLEGLAGSPD